jgi:hypothetical protein
MSTDLMAARAILVPPDKKQREAMPSILRKVIAEWRNRIETTFSEITDHLRTRTLALPRMTRRLSGAYHAACQGATGKLTCTPRVAHVDSARDAYSGATAGIA